MPPGATVLEVGVGTGLSLAAYPPHVQVTAIDLSDAMLAQAQAKIDQHHWRHIQLRQMDALNLDFPDDHFDYVVSFHVISVVPDPERMMDEMMRVCKPGGTLAIINHFRSPRRWVTAVVDRVDPVTRHLGWRTTLRLEDVVQRNDFQLERHYKSSPQSLFTVVVGRKTAQNGQGSPLGQTSAREP